MLLSRQNTRIELCLMCASQAGQSHFVSSIKIVHLKLSTPELLNKLKYISPPSLQVCLHRVFHQVQIIMKIFFAAGQIGLKHVIIEF